MTGQYFREDEAVFYITFLKADGTDNPTVLNPTIAIKHLDTTNDVMVEDLAATAITQIGTTNQYQYKYSIPADADYGTYVVIWNANVDGQDLETQETFQIVSTNIPAATGGVSPSGTRIAQIKAKYGLGYEDLQVSIALTQAREYINKNVFETVEQIYTQANTEFKLCNYITDSNFDFIVDINDIDVQEYLSESPYTVNDLNANKSSITLNHPAGFSILTMDNNYPTEKFKLKISYKRASKKFADNLEQIQLIEELLTIYYLFGMLEINNLQRGITNKSINEVSIEFNQDGVKIYREYLMKQIKTLQFNLTPLNKCQYNSLNKNNGISSILINKGY